MEKLLTVARREHSKAVMDVQQLTRQLARDQDLVRQAAQIDSQRLQLELAEMEKKLHTALAEKNLILVSSVDSCIRPYISFNKKYKNSAMKYCCCCCLVLFIIVVS